MEDVSLRLEAAGEGGNKILGTSLKQCEILQHYYIKRLKLNTVLRIGCFIYVL